MAKQTPEQILLVEGNDDQHIIWALCAKYKLTENFDVKDCKGIDPLLEQIGVQLKRSGLKTLGIIIDADANLKARWRDLKSILAAFNLPEIPSNEGTIVEKENIKVGIWLMPDNNSSGMIEDFIKFLVPNGDDLLPIVNQNLDSIESQKLNKYKDIHKAKAIIHTWLAWQEDPGTPMGLAITKKYLLPENSELCEHFICWLRKLFDA